MNKLALGTVQFGLNYGINNSSGKIKPADVYAILDLAKSSDIEILDTANAYGNSEEILGQYLKNNPRSFKIISKIPGLENVDVEKMFNESTKNLQTETLYGYLFHNFAVYQKNPDAYSQLVRLKKDKKIEKIGFSLYNPEELDEILANNLAFDLIQIPYSVFDQRFEPYFDILKKRGVEIHVRSVFLQGLVFKEIVSLDKFFEPIRSKLEELHNISDKSGVHISALCLNFAVLNDKIDKVVIGVDSVSNLKENLDDLNLQKKVSEYHNLLKELKEDSEMMILPTNWKMK